MSVLTLGDSVGDDRYTIEGEIGRGGMQEVYRAYDATLQRYVVLKVPQNERVARRFKDSAVLSARINHPNVAKTLDYFEEESQHFCLVEEHVEGLNLREVMNHFERMDPHVVAHVLHHLARGLAASHRVDVVHRDLKPSNVLVGGGLRFSAIKVTDFGIATMAGAEIGNAVAGGQETTESSKTARGQIAYMAPEVIEYPRIPSKPADVWAIAAIAWEMLTGAPPFGAGYAAIAKIVLGKTPGLPTSVTSHSQFGGIAMAVGDVILRCLRFDPASRPTAVQLVSLCDELCYLPPPNREIAVVNNYIGKNAFGFAVIDAGSKVFFHSKCAIGPPPEVGSCVWFSAYPGSPHRRAIPVVPMRKK